MARPHLVVPLQAVSIHLVLLAPVPLSFRPGARTHNRGVATRMLVLLSTFLSAVLKVPALVLPKSGKRQVTRLERLLGSVSGGSEVRRRIKPVE